jgi:Xaa-Pro aminopeptidase
MKPLGIMATEDGAGIDFRQLRLERRARVMSAMEREGIDVLVLGRRGNGKYVAGHRSLWRAVLTPFGPMCLVIRETQQIHLMGTTWDDGIPREIPTDNLSGLVWNPRVTVEAIARIDGLSRATTIGVDGMSPGMAQLFGALAPNADIVDGEQLMCGVRAAKLPAEIDCIRVAVAIAEGAMTETTSALVPGVTELELKARFAEAIARYGTTLPAFEGVFCTTPRNDDGAAMSPPLRRIARDEPVGAGDLVACSGGVLYGGYEGAATGTWPCAGASSAPKPRQVALQERWSNGVDAMIAQCRPGASPARLREAWIASGEPLPPVLLAHGVGIGVEPPLVGGSLGPEPVDDAPLHAGMVLVVQGYVWERGVGGYLGSTTVHVTADGPVRLSRIADPLALALSERRRAGYPGEQRATHVSESA